MRKKTKKKTDIQIISADISDRILKILKNKYSVYRDWLIQKYLNEYDIKTVIEDTLMENSFYIKYIRNLERKSTISKYSGFRNTRNRQFFMGCSNHNSIYGY